MTQPGVRWWPSQVKEIVAKRDECGRGEHIMKKLDLWHLLEREIVALSGGEMQRLVVSFTRSLRSMHMCDQI